MSDVWDRSTDVIGGRGSILATIVLLFVWLPSLAQRGVQAAIGWPGDGAGHPGLALVAVLIGIAAVVLASIGHLAMVAVASDPSIGRDAALRIGVRRLPAYIGLILLLALAWIVLLLPLGVAIVSAYPSVAAMRAGVTPQMSGATGIFVLVYMIALFVLGLWVEARLLAVLAPVIVNERLGLASYRRALALTRGLAWRIVGVALLFAIVAIVAVLAVQSVVGIVFRLALGPAHIATALLLTATVVTLVTCALSVVVSVFTAQLYVATRSERAGVIHDL